MRAAVYSGTRNIYQDMMTASKSLLQHSNVEKIYFLIQDDVFPYQLPQEIECINISNQQYFPPDGPNFKNILTYMVLIRAAYPKIFPQLDKILSIDIDTIVNENISQLWDLDLTDYYLAAVEEVQLTQREGSYINMGVAMFNLKKMREDGKDDQLIYNLNNFWYRYAEQDCFNQTLRGKIFILPSDYNCAIQTAPPQHEKITHFAGIYKLDCFPHFDYYKNLSYSETKRNLPDNITLDIIIPTYKDKDGLRRSLRSIPDNPFINIIVIDDCSDLNYDDILKQYPNIHLYYLNKNSGPGIARQYGIEQGCGTYITFLDSGDYFYEGGAQAILNQIQKNTYIKLYNWSYVYEKGNVLCDKISDKTIGKTYKRSFIEMYNIHFCEQGSYANEDLGFNRACKIILHQLQLYHFSPMETLIKIPVFYEHYDKNSLTKINENEFFFEKMARGIAVNELHAINITKKFKIKPQIIIDQVARIMVHQYCIFIRAVQERPDMIFEIWENAKWFYNNGFRKYSKFTKQKVQHYVGILLMPFIKNQKKEWTKRIPININRFIYELQNENTLPIRYLDVY